MNQRLVAGFDVDVLVQTLGHVLHAADAANRVGVCGRQRGRRPEAGFAVAEPLPRGRVIVFLHRVVFGVREQRRRRMTPDGLTAEPAERAENIQRVFSAIFAISAVNAVERLSI